MSKKKGDRRERKVVDMLEKAGFNVETPNYSRYQNTDFFNLFDLIAIRKNDKPHYIQVKSNSARGIQKFTSKCQDFIPFEHAKIEYWVYHKREGWRIISIDKNGRHTEYDGREDNKDMYVGPVDFKSRC